jgi:hypothetical protein|tara:strand:- start:26 stop:256 length:231 start_codon:yes stop_codon:yes gene_type:complete
MTAPNFYIVADGNAYALDDDGVPFGAPVFEDNTIDWDAAYDFDPCDEDIEYVAHMCKMLQDMKALTIEQNSEVFVK